MEVVKSIAEGVWNRDWTSQEFLNLSALPKGYPSDGNHPWGGMSRFLQHWEQTVGCACSFKLLGMQREIASGERGADDGENLLREKPRISQVRDQPEGQEGQL